MKFFRIILAASFAFVIPQAGAQTNFATLIADGAWTWYDGLAWALVTASYSTNLSHAVAGSNLSISWPATHLGWILQKQTNNPNVGLATNWMDVPGSATVHSTNIVINPASPAVFFRLRST